MQATDARFLPTTSGFGELFPTEEFFDVAERKLNPSCNSISNMALPM
jgi:hypothetical protein